MLTWKLTSKDKAGHTAWKAKARRGHYEVHLQISDRKYFYGAEHHIDGKKRTVTPEGWTACTTIVTPDEAKEFAQRDWEQGGADERTREEPQPMHISIRL